MQFCVHTCFYIVLILKKKYLYLFTSVINFCNYIYNYTVAYPLHLPTPPNLFPTLTVSHLNSSKNVLQYNMTTISTFYLFFDVST